MSRQERDEFQRGRESMHSEVEALRAQLPSWRPIAEAPKDGSVVWTDLGTMMWDCDSISGAYTWVHSGLDGKGFDGGYYGNFPDNPSFYLVGVPPVPEV